MPFYFMLCAKNKLRLSLYTSTASGALRLSLFFLLQNFHRLGADRCALVILHPNSLRLCDGLILCFKQTLPLDVQKYAFGFSLINLPLFSLDQSILLGIENFRRLGVDRCALAILLSLPLEGKVSAKLTDEVDKPPFSCGRCREVTEG